MKDSKEGENEKRLVSCAHVRAPACLWSSCMASSSNGVDDRTIVGIVGASRNWRHGRLVCGALLGKHCPGLLFEMKTRVRENQWEKNWQNSGIFDFNLGSLASCATGKLTCLVGEIGGITMLTKILIVRSHFGRCACFSLFSLFLSANNL